MMSSAIQQPTETIVHRYFYKCNVCLGAFATDGHPERGSLCDCGGRLECMGRVKRHRLVEGAMGTPCDARCTNASGPKCDCQCDGANHGSKMIVFFERDLGGVPRVVSSDADREKRHARRDEYARLVSEAQAVLETLPAEPQGYSFRKSPTRALRAALHASVRSRAHHHRMKLLRKAIEATRA